MRDKETGTDQIRDPQRFNVNRQSYWLSLQKDRVSSSQAHSSLSSVTGREHSNNKTLRLGTSRPLTLTKHTQTLEA